MRYELLLDKVTRKLPTLAHVLMELDACQHTNFIVWDTELSEYVDLDGNPIHFDSTFSEYIHK